MQFFRKISIFRSAIIIAYVIMQKLPLIRAVLWSRSLEPFHHWLCPTNPFLWQSIGNDVVISPKAEIINSRSITLENGAWIEDHAIISAEGGSIRIGKNTHILPYAIVKAQGGNITFGEYCTVNPFCVIYGFLGGVEIGDAVRIATQTVITPANHIFEDPELQIRLQGIESKGIKIKNDVWLGSGVRILDGSNIGTGVVVAAGSVVTKNIPDFAVVGGVPAKVIRWRKKKE